MITAQTPPAGRLPVSERVWQHIIATLATITKAQGYSVNAQVLRPSPGLGDQVLDGRMVVYSEEPQQVDSTPQMSTGWKHSFAIVCDVVESEKSTTALDTRRSLVLADAIYALTHDSDLGNRPVATRDGLAEWTEASAPVIPPMDPEAHEGQVIAVVDVLYRTLFNNPYVGLHDFRVVAADNVGTGQVKLTLATEAIASVVNGAILDPSGVTISGVPATSIVQNDGTHVTLTGPGSWGSPGSMLIVSSKFSPLVLPCSITASILITSASIQEDPDKAIFSFDADVVASTFIPSWFRVQTISGIVPGETVTQGASAEVIVGQSVDNLLSGGSWSLHPSPSGVEDNQSGTFS